MVQISRDEHILTNLTDEERASIRGSLSAAINEREEIQKLLDQIRELAEKSEKPDKPQE
jgi:5-bromo-4-chloroindolyl phosphate hydrolysis protein